MTSAALTVITTGPLATHQDRGRPGYADLGVPRSGAADVGSLMLANRLVGNSDDAACLEVTLGGWSARATGDLVVAVTGPTTRVRIDGRAVGTNCRTSLRDGQVIEVEAPARGCRNYVAVRGGFDAEPELGSRSTDTLSGLGPPRLQPGDVLPVGTQSERWPSIDFAPTAPVDDIVELTAGLGPRDDRVVDPTELAVGTWSVTPTSNRIGMRLDRMDDSPLLRHRPELPELRSEGVPLGGVQIPPGGRPVIFLADHPVTGGYPVVAVLTSRSVQLAAQCAPGAVVRLRLR